MSQSESPFSKDRAKAPPPAIREIRGTLFLLAIVSDEDDAATLRADLKRSRDQHRHHYDDAKNFRGRETTIYVTMIILFSWTAALIFHEFLGTTVFGHGHVHLSGLSLWSHLTGAFDCHACLFILEERQYRQICPSRNF